MSTRSEESQLKGQKSQRWSEFTCDDDIWPTMTGLSLRLRNEEHVSGVYFLCIYLSFMLLCSFAFLEEVSVLGVYFKLKLHREP
jgi:hypothetical protein